MTIAPRRLRVVIADDSAVARELLADILETVGAMDIVAVARDGEEAVACARRHRPDVVCMDVNMPRLDGYAATRAIMETAPVPIVIVSSQFASGEVRQSFRAIEAGALAIVGAPAGPGHPGYEAAAGRLVETVALMADVKVIRRWPAVARPRQPVADAAGARPAPAVVAIGASTGGPPALQAVLAALPGGFPLPILVVQHIAPGFVQGLADWLGQTTALPVEVVTTSGPLRPGQVHLAPDDRHLAVAGGDRVVLLDDPPEHGQRPAVAVLFRTVAACYGGAAAGVLLSGMGQDGAQALRDLRDAGALTLVQAAATCVVNGMPGEAVRLGAAVAVLAPAEIGARLATLAARPLPVGVET